MENKKKIIQNLNSIQGSIIAVVYTFEGENAPGFKHYDVWRSNVIADWINAINEIGCKPYIIDVRTFISKAMMDTLPHLDFIINLNAGNINLDNLGLIPSVCSFLNIPCIPCSSGVCSVGEDKFFANTIAKNSLIKVPKSYPDNIEGGIIRHRNYGSSIGIRKTASETTCKENEISQEFIVGTDITIPILFNPLNSKLELLPAIAYMHHKGEDWYLGEKEKISHDYDKVSVRLPIEVSKEILNLAKSFDISTFCRIDTRVKNFKDFEIDTITLDNLYFIEINPTPTIHNTINFANAINELNKSDSHYGAFNLYKKHVKDYTVTGYILTSAIFAIKAKHSQWQD